MIEKNNKARRVLIFTAQTGMGHQSVAEAVKEGLERGWHPKPSVEIVDFFDVLRVPIMRRAPSLYGAMVRHMLWLYDALWKATNRAWVSRMLTALVELAVGRRLVDYLGSQQPDVVISTHPLYIADLVVRARDHQGRSYTVGTVVGDPVSPHASWACPNADAIFVPTTDAADRLRRFKVAPSRLHVVGYPVRREFFELSMGCCTAGGPARIDEEPIIVLTAGGVGSRAMSKIARTLSGSITEARVVVLTGSDRRLFESLKRAAIPGVEPLPAIPDTAALFAQADLVIAKAGPATVFEVATLGRPLLLTGEVGRQEHGNIMLAERLGIGQHCPESAQLLQCAAEMLEQPRCRPLRDHEQAPLQIAALLNEAVEAVGRAVGD